MTRSNRFSYLAVFLFGVFTTASWQWVKSAFSFRPVQYLRSSDKIYQTVPEREEHLLEMTFRVVLDGQQIYRSPEFGRNLEIPYRETLSWDDSGKILLFEVGGRRLFGYDMVQGRALSNVALLDAKMSPMPVKKYGFEGKWPSAIRN